MTRPRSTRPRPIALQWLSLVASAGLTAGAATAQRPDTELAKLRAEHEKGLASASRVVDDIHRLTLRQLERERADAGDYETAARVKERLDTMDRAPGTAAIVPPPLTHTLLAARSLTRDGANTEGGREYVDFRKTGGKALWDILGLEKGTYEVFLTYSVGLQRFDESSLGDGANGPREAPGGEIVFGEVTGLASLAGGSAPTLQKRVMTTGAWENYIRESIGTYDFRNATVNVKLEAARATDGGLLRLRQIELVKVVGVPETATADTAPSETARTLQDMRGRHQMNIREAADSLRPRFASEFLKLEQALTAAGDTAGATAVARSRLRLFPDARAVSNEDGQTDYLFPDAGEEPEEKKP